MNPPTRPRFARLCWSLVALAWLAVIAALINAGFTPDYWMLRHFEGATLPYPTGAVIQFAVLAGAELLVTVLIVRPWKPGRLWLRLLIALVLLLAWSFPWLAAALHQPWATVVLSGRYVELTEEPRFLDQRVTAHEELAREPYWWQPGFSPTLADDGARPIRPLFFRIVIESVRGHFASPGDQEQSTRASWPAI